MEIIRCLKVLLFDNRYYGNIIFRGQSQEPILKFALEPENNKKPGSSNAAPDICKHPKSEWWKCT